MVGILVKFKHFLRSTSGNVATIFAIALMPVSVMGGGAIDFAQAMKSRGRLAEALDAAALAVGSQANLSALDAQQMVMEFITSSKMAKMLKSILALGLIGFRIQ